MAIKLPFEVLGALEAIGLSSIPYAWIAEALDVVMAALVEEPLAVVQNTTSAD